MDSVLNALYDIITERKNQPQEGSYTCYLFREGLDKILKKIGEESAEVIISAKNHQNENTTLEICDLLYHLLILMAEEGIRVEDIEGELINRQKKTGNLKQMKITDKNT